MLYCFPRLDGVNYGIEQNLNYEEGLAEKRLRAIELRGGKGSLRKAVEERGDKSNDGIQRN